MNFSDLLFAAGAVEGAAGEIEKEQRDGGINEEAPVIGSRLPGMTKLVDILGKEESKESEEESGDFKPEDAASMSEWSPDRLAEFAGAAGYGTALLGLPLDIGRGLLPHGMSALRGAIAQHAGGDANSDAEFSAETIRFHEEKCSSET